MSDDTPTLAFDQPTPPPPAPLRRERQPKKPRPSGPAIAFIVLAVLVVAAIVVLVVVLVTRANENPATGLGPTNATNTSAPPTTPSRPATTPSTVPAPSQAPAPVAAPGVFTELVVPSEEQGCSHGGHGGRKVQIQVSWATNNAQSVWIAPGQTDAANAQFQQIPASGTQANFSTPIDYDCSQRSSTYTITLIGEDGTHVSRTWTVRNVGTRF